MVTLDVQRPLLYLVQAQALKLPGGVLPGTTSGTLDTVFTPAQWEAYPWTGSTSPKPSWRDLQEADQIAETRDWWTEHCRALDRQAQARIRHAYAVETEAEEWHLRLRGGQTPAQDTERDRLREIYRAQKALVLTNNLENLRAYNPQDDALWATAPWAPIGAQADASAGGGTVWLSASLEYDGSAPVTQWEWRSKTGTADYGAWQVVDSADALMVVEVPGLATGGWTFDVRARNSIDAGDVATVTATV